MHSIFKKVVRHATETIKEAVSLMYSKGYKERAKMKPGSFTRRRKMPFEDVVMYMLHPSKASAHIKLEEYMGIKKRAGFRDVPERIAQQSFSEARSNLKWEACRELFDKTVDSAYSDGGISLLDGYRLLAIDGTKVQLPCDRKGALLKEFGSAGSSGQSPSAQASCLYDVLEDVIVDARIEAMKTGERELANMHICRLRELGQDIPNLILFDRGYASEELVRHLLDGDAGRIDFIMRVKTKFNIGIDSLPLGDHIFLFHGMPLRVVKFELSSGETESLLTSLTEIHWNTKDFSEIYSMRWPIETKYNTLKHRLQLENFSGHTPLAIRQDFFISVFLANIVALLVSDAQIIADEKRMGKANKHLYKINVNSAIGKFRGAFIMSILIEDDDLRAAMFQRVLRSFADSVVPIRPGRSTPRYLNTRNSNFHHNSKSNL
jgi:hypothetical protein